MQEIVGVQYKTASKVYYFSPNGIHYNINDEVLVDTISGPAYGVISIENKMVNDSEIEPPLKSVIRLVNDEDRKQIAKIRKKAEDSLPVVIKKIEDLNLAMKVIEVEYSFDESKITISFTSEGRVDFRELLKLLASSLHCKIELRQIGTRDEVKAVGGLGLCGMPCCCTRFLKEPEHVTVKMCKTQNLSMSPTKTGGACGRMMCCLSYEDSMYKELLDKMPKVGTKIKTAEGEGTVTSNNIIKGVVTLKVVNSQDDSYKFKDYSLEELGLKPLFEKCADCDKCNKTEEDNKSQENQTHVDNKNRNNDKPKENENLVAKGNKNNYNNEGAGNKTSNKPYLKNKNFNKNKFNNRGEKFNGIQNK